MESTEKKFIMEKDIYKSNAEIQQQVYILAETILRITRNLEAVLSNMKSVTNTLSRISLKLTADEKLAVDEHNVLHLTETWLSQEPFTYHGKLISFPELHSFTNGGAQTDYQHLTNGVHEAVSPDCSAPSSGQGLDEVHELDWDGHGLELSESFHSYNGKGISAFSEPFAMAAANEPGVPCASYQGVYEERMEYTLEMEEAFWSDQSSDTVDNHDGLSPHDSGVTQLATSTAAESSASPYDGDSTTSPCDVYSTNSPFDASSAISPYDADLNTWDMYAIVNIDDLSAESSANSTPRVVRRVKNIKHISSSNTLNGTMSPRSNSSVYSDESVIAERFMPSRDIRNDSVSSQDINISVSAIDTRPAHTVSQGESPTPATTPTSVSSEPSSSHSVMEALAGLSAKTQLKRKTKVDMDAYYHSSEAMCVIATLPTSLRKNNYKPKSRRPVFV